MARPVRHRFRLLVDSLESRQMLATTELISNGNFAANAAGWTLTGQFKADAAYSNGRSLPGYGYLAAADGSLASSNSLVGTLSQSVSIPAGVASADLTFWYKHSTQETAGPNDTLAVRIKNPSGATLTTLTTQTNATHAAYVQAGPFNLLPYAGQTIIVSFEGQTNASLGTVFRVDDVSLQADVPTPPSAVVTPTAVYPGIIATAGLPTLNTPVPTLRWNAVSGATGYGVLVERLSGSTWSTYYNSEASPSFPSPIVGTTFTPPTTFSAGTYRWKVRAYDGSNIATGYTPALHFSVVTTGYNRAVGLDISDYQTVTSWANVKTNGTAGTTTDDTSFLYIKATEGFTFDATKFVSHANGAAAAGIPFGAYHFARPGNNSAASEAQHFYSIISSRLTAGNLVPMLDFEDRSANTVALGKAALSNWVNDFCEAFISLSGVVPIVYTFVSYATSYLNTSVIRYPLWMAQYDTEDPNPAIPLTSDAPSGTSPWPGGAWSMWQYTSNRTVSGFTANVDSNVANADVATFYDMFKIPSATKGSISGTLFNDLDNDGTKDAGEAALSGRTVYFDADNDGLHDAGEPTALTNASGLYTFSNLLAGAYYVRQVLPGGFEATGPASHAIQITPGQAATARDFGSRPIDGVAPVFSSKRFNYDQASRSITLVLSEDVGATFTAADITLTNGSLAAVPFSFAYDAATRTATLTPTAPLTNNDYTLSIAANAFTDLAGNPNAADSLAFHWLDGDINRDRGVNFGDLLILAQHYGLPGGYDQGDLTYDGAVNFSDLLVLAQNYGVNLLQQPALARSSAPASRSGSVRSRDGLLQ